MISVPCSCARRATRSNTCENGWPGCVAAPSDIEITAHWFCIAHSIPARIPVSEPEPAFESTLPAKISASWATP